MRRVLVLEPQKTVVDDYRFTLCGAEAAAAPAEDHPRFDLHFVEDRETAVRRTCSAVAEDRPFSVAFIDPGEGDHESHLKFLARLRAADPALPIVVVSTGWHPDPLEASRRVPPAGRLYFLQKPFHGREVEQLALALSETGDARGTVGSDALGAVASAPFLATSLAGVLVFDPLDRLIAANDAMHRLFPELADCLEIGRRYEDLQKEMADRLLPTDTLFRSDSWRRERMKRHQAGGGLIEQRLRGGRWILIGESVLENGETHCHHYDITALKQRQASEAAATRFAQVSQCLGGFFDRLESERQVRRPEPPTSGSVVPIGLARARQAENDFPPPSAELANAALLAKVKAAAGRQRLDPERCDLNALIGAELDRFADALPQEVTIEAVEGAGLWPVLVDPRKLVVVLLELLWNACEAMEQGGRITLETANRRLDRAFVASRCGLAAGDYVCLSVGDTGPGMPPALAERAFNPFFTSKGPAFSGLGLSIVRGFVQQSGGYVEIVSAEAAGAPGAVIEIYLRRLRADTTAQPAPLRAGS